MPHYVLDAPVLMLELLNVTLMDEAVPAGRLREVVRHQVFQSEAHSLLLTVDPLCCDLPVAKQSDSHAAADFLQADYKDFWA